MWRGASCSDVRRPWSCSLPAGHSDDGSRSLGRPPAVPRARCRRAASGAARVRLLASQPTKIVHSRAVCTPASTQELRSRLWSAASGYHQLKGAVICFGGCAVQRRAVLRARGQPARRRAVRVARRWRPLAEMQAPPQPAPDAVSLHPAHHHRLSPSPHAFVTPSLLAVPCFAASTSSAPAHIPARLPLPRARPVSAPSAGKHRGASARSAVCCSASRQLRIRLCSARICLCVLHLPHLCSPRRRLAPDTRQPWSRSLSRMRGSRISASASSWPRTTSSGCVIR
jgi:hypothetical protein